MKKLLLILGLLGLAVISNSEEQTRYLHYRFNPNVIITITNVDCFLPELKAKYPWAAVATRIDGDRLIACYTHEGDEIVIQWYKGDQSRFPANIFLTNPKIDETYKQKPNL